MLDIGVYNLGFMRMVMGDSQPEDFSSQVHINEYGTDDFSTILLKYPGGRSACVTTAIGVTIPRYALIVGTKGSISLEDFQHAEKLTVQPEEGEAYTLELPVDVNGFEYQIRETERCVKAKMISSDVMKKEDTLEILELMDRIRASWGLTFACEKE